MFSTEEFIEASRKFVCIRIETFENKESEELVKFVLHGRYANTSFVIFDPHATKMLTRSGRSPGMAMINGPSRTDASGNQNEQIVEQMNRIARQYRARGDLEDATLQDFHSLRQALNCSAADQRLLVVVRADDGERQAIEGKLQSLFVDPDIQGKFHLDFVSPSTDGEWSDLIRGAKTQSGLLVIRPSQFGVDGQVQSQLRLDEDLATIKKSLLRENVKFSKTEKRKDYEAHVQAGHRQRVYFENEISKEGTEEEKRRTGRGPQRRNR